MIRKKRDAKTEADDDVKAVAKAILEEARKRAKYEMECLTELILQEAKVASRYARDRPFYIA